MMKDEFFSNYYLNCRDVNIIVMNLMCGAIFRFDAIWDDSNVEHGEVRNYKILYSVNDKTVSIKVSNLNVDAIFIILLNHREIIVIL